MSFAKAFKKSLAIALLSLLIGFNSFFISDTLAEPISNTQEIQEFKQLIDRTHAAWNSHNPDALSKFYAQDADLIFYDALPMQYQG